ncbi:MAG: hypothetical protein E3K40_13480 [Candidatus Brocadia sp.]|nr:Ig-like domain-containing protein [Candidatus Brocadia sp.]MDG6027686.1 hypothetical protein [Candidatus Brocadia sp.]
MKFSNQKSIFFPLIWMGIVFLCSCAPTRSYRPYEEGVRIIVSPHKLSVHSGSEDKVFVQVLDKQGGPLFGIKVTATSTLPTVAAVTSEALTDPVGKAIFTVSGISPGTTQIVLSAAGQKAMMEVVFIGH